MEHIEDLDINEWQIQAIKQGIDAVEQGKTFPFEDIKKYWEQKFVYPDPVNNMA